MNRRRFLLLCASLPLIGGAPRPPRGLRRHPRSVLSGPPVLLVHGLSSRAQFFELPTGRSLVDALVAAGHDVWQLDLGGRQGTGRRQAGAPGELDLDHHGKVEVRAAVQHIARDRGLRVAVVGHSMGGMVTAIYADWYGTHLLAGVVAMGSPLRFTAPDPLMRASKGTMAIGRALPRVPSPAALRPASLRKNPLRIEAMLYAEGSIDPETRRAMIRNSVGPITRGELAQLQDAVKTASFRSRDGARDYALSPQHMDCPVLAIAGRADRIAPPDRVAPWRRGPPGVRRQWLLAGRAGGMGHDYGHLDMVVGSAASAELFPVIVDFLAELWS